MRSGIHPGVPEGEYHADPALSSSQLKDLLRAPAYYRHRLTHPLHLEAFDVGTAAHTMVLGTGAPIAVIPTDVLGKNGATSTNGAREFIEQARERGETPIKAEQYLAVKAMADAVLAHPKARAVLEAEGDAELSLWWEEGELPMRARLDKLAMSSQGPVIADLKTTGSLADPAAWPRTVVNYRYDLSAAHYLTGYEAITGERPAWLWIAVEKAPPHLVSVTQASPDFIDLGAQYRARALDIYRECLAADHWPGYPTEITTIDPPRWAS